MSDQLAVIASDVNNLLSSGASLPEIQAHLETLWNAGGDETAITTVWNQVQHLATVAQDAAALARSAVDVANEMMDQRNLIADQLSDVVKEHEDLVDAVHSADYDHPQIAAMIDTIQEEAYSDLVDSLYHGEALYDANPYETISENGHLGEDFDAEDGTEIISIILGAGDDLPEDMYVELADFITSFMDRVRAHKAAEHKKYLENAERMRVEWLANQQKAQAAS